MHAISMHRAYSGNCAYLQVELQCNNTHFEKIIRCEVTSAFVEVAHRIFDTDGSLANGLKIYTCHDNGCFLL